MKMDKTMILKKILTGSATFEDLVQLPDKTLATIAKIALNSIKTASDAELLGIINENQSDGQTPISSRFIDR